MSVLRRKVKEIYAPRAFGYASGNYRNGGENLSIPQKHIIRTVYHAGGGELTITSVDRPNSSWHSKSAAIDFGGNDPLEFQVGMRIWKERKWLGGLGLGKPPHADRHLHVDARQYAGADRGTWQRYFIELDKRGDTIPMTTATLRALAPAYGVELRDPIQRVEDAARETKEAAVAVLQALGIGIIGFLVLREFRRK